MRGEIEDLAPLLEAESKDDDEGLITLETVSQGSPLLTSREVTTADASSGTSRAAKGAIAMVGLGGGRRGRAEGIERCPPPSVRL